MKDKNGYLHTGKQCDKLQTKTIDKRKERIHS